MADDLKDLNNIPRKKTIELMTEFNSIDRQIDILLLKREKIRLELVKRYQVLEETEDFKPKQKTIY